MLLGRLRDRDTFFLDTAEDVRLYLGRDLVLFFTHTTLGLIFGNYTSTKCLNFGVRVTEVVVSLFQTDGTVQAFPIDGVNEEFGIIHIEVSEEEGLIY